MYVVFSDDRDTLRSIENAFPRSEHVHATPDWHDFVFRAPLGECRVLGAQRAETCRRLSALGPQRVAEMQPLILVAARTLDLAPALGQIAPADIVWLSDVEHTLWSVVRRATTGSVLVRIARSFATAESLAPLIREALARACTSDRPITTVAELGMVVGRDRRTMWRLWRQSTTGRQAPRLEDALHWLLLLRASLRKDRYVTWHTIAQSLHVHEHTLARSAQALMGTTLSCLTLQGAQPVTAQFVERVLRPIAGERAWDILR